MKQLFLFFFSAAILFSSASAQSVRQLRKTIELKMPKGPGDNGGTVAQNGKNRYFYATVAGNKTYSLAYFNVVGEMMSPPDLALLADVRGLWYNPKTKQLEGNGYKDFGWFTYDLDKKGIPEKINIKKEGSNQPDANSAGVLNTDANEVLFLDGLNVVCYSTDGTDKRKSIQIHFGAMNI